MSVPPSRLFSVIPMTLIIHQANGACRNRPVCPRPLPRWAKWTSRDGTRVLKLREGRDSDGVERDDFVNSDVGCLRRQTALRYIRLIVACVRRGRSLSSSISSAHDESIEVLPAQGHSGAGTVHNGAPIPSDPKAKLTRIQVSMVAGGRTTSTEAATTWIHKTRPRTECVETSNRRRRGHTNRPKAVEHYAAWFHAFGSLHHAT
jgi:hypothetical protein